MTDDQQGLEFQGTSQGQTQQPQAAPQVPPAAPQEPPAQTPITKGDLDAAMQRVLQEAKSFMGRRASEKIEAVSTKLDALEQTVKEFKAAGIPLSDAAVTAARDGIVREGLIANQAQAQPAPADGYDLIKQATDAVYAKYGVVVEPEDDEAKLVDMTTPAAFLASLPAAAIAKKQRLQTQPAPAQPPQPPGKQFSSPTPATGGGLANPIADITDIGELWKLSGGQIGKKG